MPERNQNSLTDAAREGVARGRARRAAAQPALRAGDRRAPARRRTVVATAGRTSGGGEGRGTTKPVSKRATPARQKPGSSSKQTGSRGGARRNEK